MGVPFQVDVNVVTHGAEKVNELEQKLSKMQNKSVDIKLKIDGKSQLDSISKQLQALQKQNLNLKFDQNSINKSAQQTAKQYSQNIQKQLDSNKIKYNIDTGKYSAFSSKMNKELSAYGNQNTENIKKATTALSTYNEALDKLQNHYSGKNKLGEEELSKTFESMIKAGDTFKNTLSQIKDESSKVLASTVAETSANKVVSYMNENSKAVKKYGEELRQLEQQYRSMTTVEEKATNDKTFANLKSRISAEGLTGNSMWAELTRGFKQIGQFAMTYGMIQNTAMQLPSKIISAVTDVDSAMTNLYKVTDETDQRYQKFLNNAGNTSKSLGRDMSSYINQTAEWAKLGYSLSDSEQLSKLSSIYANVGEVGDETAVSDMVTAMKAFNMQASDAQKIIDSYNRLGNEFAVTSADIGEGISNSASSLATASNDFDQSVAMITGMAEITQSANEGGSALKILAMRLRGYDEETQSYTNDIEELSGKVADLTKTAETPGGISLFTDDTKQTYKDTYTLMEDISKIYDKLSDKNRAELLEVIAGKNRGNQIAALIQAFQSGQVQKAYEASKNSEGSAQQEQERWLNSIEAKQQQFSSQFQKLSTDVLSSDFVKGAVDFGSGFLGFLDGAIKKIGIFKTAVGTVGIAKIIKSIA